MNTRKNYIFDEWLAAYAAGQLPVGLSLMIAAHIDLCPELIPRLRQYEEVGGQLLDSLPPCMDVGYSMLENLLNRIEEQEENFPDLATPKESSFKRRETVSRNAVNKRADTNVFPRAVKRFLGYDYDDVRWRFAGAGSVISHLWQDEEAGRLWMFRTKGGSQTPIHTHSGKEWTLILQGGYHTVEGHFVAGDLHQVDENDTHQPVMDEGEDCICLVFTEGPTIYSRFLPKVMQHYTRI